VKTIYIKSLFEYFYLNAGRYTGGMTRHISYTYTLNRKKGSRKWTPKLKTTITRSMRWATLTSCTACYISIYRIFGMLVHHPGWLK